MICVCVLENEDSLPMENGNMWQLLEGGDENLPKQSFELTAASTKMQCDHLH